MAARFNVVGAFPDTRKAEQAVERLAQAGVDKSSVRLVRPGTSRDGDRVSELRAEMRDEISEGFAGPGLGLVTPSQAKGARTGIMLGFLVGAVIGAAVGLAWGFGSDSVVPPLGRFFIAFIPFAVGGSVVGAVAGGGTKPRADAAFDSERPLADARLAGERDTIVAVHVADATAAERAQHVLEELGAERVDAVNADGTPLPPQSENPRPADPPGRWWWPGRARG